MISIETADGYVDMTTALFLSIAKVQELYNDADVTATFEYVDADRRGQDVYHVIARGHLAISGEIGKGYESRDYRYVIDSWGNLRGVERLVSSPEAGDDWFHVEVDPETWEEIES